jgi:hypothetical protein
MWYVTSHKQGMSALGLQRVLGLGSYETAWTWLHKLRRAMVRLGRDRLSGTVEVDEVYIGGVKKGKPGRGADGKALVLVSATRRRQTDRADTASASKGRILRELDPSSEDVCGARECDPHGRLERLYTDLITELHSQSDS